jgi:hypothetical protein
MGRITGSSSRRDKGVRIALGSLLSLAAIMYGGVAQAIHTNTTFELDGNSSDSNLAVNPPSDFDTVYNDIVNNGADDGSLAHQFVNDAAEPDPTHHEPSNKDEQGNDAWGCVQKPNVNNKDDIRHAYAATYTIGGDQYLFFGANRDSNKGSSNIGIWFFQDEVGCVASGSGDFTGDKTNGDIFIVSRFEQGGTASFIDLFLWEDPDGIPDNGDEVLGDGNGHAEVPFATGADCQAADADTVNPDMCATANGASITTLWDGATAKNLYFEGGINLSETFEDIPCFTGFMSETRSSHEVDANLFDIVFGDLNVCGTISARKYHDKDANGSRDADGADNTLATADDEVFLNGWTIKVYKDENDNNALDGGDTLAASGVTSGTGAGTGTVTFADLNAGEYVVCEELQATWTNSDPGGGSLCKDVSLALAGNEQRIFGNYKTATKTGTKFEDDNADGVKDAGEDSPSVAFTINAYRDKDNDGVLDVDGVDPLVDETTVVATTTTSTTTGAYTLTLDPGHYIVCEVQQTDWFQSYPKPATTGSADCSQETSPDLADRGWDVDLLSEGTDSGNDFGNFQKADISGVKFKDADDDGVFDATEGAPAVSFDIRLYKDAGASPDGVLDSGDTLVGTQATSTTTGAYSFSDLLPGKYFVCEETETNWAATYPDPASADECSASGITGLVPDGYVVDLAGTDALARDFGNSPLSTVSVTFNPLVTSPSNATHATLISCKDKDGNSIGTNSVDSDTYTSNSVRVRQSKLTCEITFIDP